MVISAGLAVVAWLIYLAGFATGIILTYHNRDGR